MPNFSLILRKHPHWPVVKDILNSLNKKGYKAYLAGGCVRDLFLNRTSPDLDVATSAPPHIVESLFSKTLDVGRAFGTIVVIQGEVSIEVTTFRRDGVYLDGRHPQAVEFSDEKEDASRRDFTMNAIFYDALNNKILDYFNGVNDIQQGVLRAVGDPQLRFKEDKLRILRALRFESQLGFKIEKKTLAAIAVESQGVSQISKERVFNELKKMADGSNFAEAFSHLIELGIWHNFVGIPSQCKPQIEDFKSFGLKGLKALLSFLFWWHREWDDVDLTQRWKSWPISREIRHSVEDVLSAVETLTKEASFFKKVKAFNKKTGVLALQIWKVKTIRNKKTLDEIDEFIKSYLKLCDSSGHLPPPILTGKDLMEAGERPGPNIKKILDEAFEYQIRNGQVSKEHLLSRFLSAPVKSSL